MTDFSFTFSYDRDGHIAWLALDGCLDWPAADRMRHVLRAAIGGLEPRRLLVDARDVTPLDGASIDHLVGGGAAPECDIVLVTQGEPRHAGR